MATRVQNEKRFRNWEDFPDGTRKYWTDRRGYSYGFQRMVKWVDDDENTLQVVQEIYNDNGVMIERHQKFPVDTGHEKLIDEE